MKTTDNPQNGIALPKNELNNQIGSADNADDNKHFISESDDGKIKFSDSKFFRFIKSKGVRKVRVGQGFELVLVENYIVSKISTSEVKEIVLEHLKTLDNEKMLNYILNRTVLFSLKYLDAVTTINLKMHRDIPGESFYYFQNGVVRVTAESIESPVPYHLFKRLIWKDHIILRDFDPNMNIDDTPSTFQDFIYKLSNSDEKRFLRMCTVMGYCLFNYKTSATARAVIIYDQKVSSTPEGGSGKSLILCALSKLRKTALYDGKSFNPNANFVWQKIDESVCLVGIDDVKRGFNLEYLFSIVTSGFRNINKKNKDEIELSVEDSPTIVITTNNVLRGSGGSYLRRQHQVEVYQFFNKDLTPIDYYKKDFFSSWNEDEWAQFDVFMLSCVLLFLKNGVTECQEDDKQKKDAIRATSQSFVEWIEEDIELLTENNGVETLVGRDAYSQSTNQKYNSISTKKFTDYVKKYCEIYGHDYIQMTHLRPRRFRIVLVENKND